MPPQNSDIIQYMLKAGVSRKHAAILMKFAALQGEVLRGRTQIKGADGTGCRPDAFVDEPHLMHGLVRGIYVPKGDKFALSIQLTEKEKNYGKEITYFSPSEWRIEYRPPTDKRPLDGKAKSDTHALRNCYEGGVPVGILRSLGKATNEVLGLGKIIAIEGGGFSIAPFRLEEHEDRQFGDLVDAHIDSKVKQGDYSAPDAEATVLARRGQSLFRKRLIDIYAGSCGFCGFDVEEFLIASHIVRWADDKVNRLNPRNGILLCRLCDRAFEAGEIKISADLSIAVSPKLSSNRNPAVNSWLAGIAAKIRIKETELSPNPSFVERRNRLAPAYQV